MAEKISSCRLIAWIGKQTLNIATKQQNGKPAEGQQTANQGQRPAEFENSKGKQCDDAEQRHQKQIEFHDPIHLFNLQTFVTRPMNARCMQGFLAAIQRSLERTRLITKNYHRDWLCFWTSEY